MNQLQIFENAEFGKVRTIQESNNILFCGSDVSKALGYADSTQAIRKNCKEDGVSTRRVIDNLGREQQAKFINEGNLYRLIAHSKLPTAEKFESWVFDEVLPSIRKTGGYVNNDEFFISEYLPNADESTKLFVKTSLETFKRLNAKIKEDKPKVLFAEAVSTAKTSILIGELAKILKQNGIDTGQNRLFEYLRNNGYLVKRNGSDRNMPTQRSMEAGLFEIKETSITNADGSIRVTKTTKVTGKGQQYFINLFLKDKAS